MSRDKETAIIVVGSVFLFVVSILGVGYAISASFAVGWMFRRKKNPHKRDKDEESKPHPSSSLNTNTIYQASFKNRFNSHTQQQQQRSPPYA